MNSEKKPRGRPKNIHTPITYFTEKRGKMLYDDQRHHIW